MTDTLDTEMSTEVIIKINKIFYAIYESEKFKSLTQRYFQIYRLKENKTQTELNNQYKNFLESTITEKFKNVRNREDVKDIRETAKVLSSRMKKRWAKSAIDSLDKKPNKYLKKEYLLLKEEYIKNEGSILSKDIEKPEDIIEIRETFLKQWSSSVFYNVSNYPYLDEMSIKKINSAFYYDLILCVTEILKDNYDFDLNKIMLNTPPGLSAGLFIEHNKKQKKDYFGMSKINDLLYKLNEYDSKNSQGQPVDLSYGINPSDFDRDDTFKGLMLQLSDSKTMAKALSELRLDEYDLSFIRFAYSYSVLNYSKVYISEILKFLGLNDSSYNYKKIKKKILKLPYYTFYIKEFDDSGNPTETTFNLFSMARVKKDENGRLVAEIVKSSVAEVDKLSTQLMYRDELKKLTNYTSVNLAYLLEGERSMLIKSGADLTKKHRLDIDYIKYHVHMDKQSTLKQRLSTLDVAFKEILNNQFIIKEYSMGNSYFEVLFYDDIEKRQLLLNNTILSLPDYLLEQDTI